MTTVQYKQSKIRFSMLLCCMVCLWLVCGTNPAYGINTISSVSVSQSKNSETVTINLDRPVSFKSRTLNKSDRYKLPHRLYIDLLNTGLTPGMKQIVYPESSLIKKIRIAYTKKTTARVVLDLNKKLSGNDYTIAQYESPPRIEISMKRSGRHVSRKAAAAPPKKVSKKQTVAPEKKISPVKKPVKAAKAVKPQPSGSAAVPPKPEKKKASAEKPVTASADQRKLPAHPEPPRETAKTAPTAQASSAEKTAAEPDSDKDLCVVVIDPGHGGKDPGAIGYKGIREKDVCLAIATELKKVLDEIPSCKALLTRTTDRFLSLDDRSAIANAHNADLFISIHANSHNDRKLKGIETYYLNFSSDETARRVAARENFTTPSKISDLEMILFDLMQSEKINKSSILAGYIHNALVSNIMKSYKDLRNLGVKHAPMRVLIDAEMPCILIETAFISNPTEARRLKTKDYQRLLAQAIVSGIDNYKVGHKTALYKTSN